MRERSVLLSVLSFLVVGCASTQSRTEIIEPPECTTEECEPATESWWYETGLLVLEGELALTNLLNLLDFARKADDMIAAARKEIEERYMFYRCGPACKQKIHITETKAVFLNSDEAEQSQSEECQPVVLQTSRTINGLCITLASPALTAINNFLEEAKAACEKRNQNPACKPILLVADSEAEEFKFTEDGLMCSIQYKNKITVYCSKNSGQIKNLGFFIREDAEASCNQAPRCEDSDSRGSTPTTPSVTGTQKTGLNSTLPPQPLMTLSGEATANSTENHDPLMSADNF